MARTKTEIALMRKWDKEYPQYAPDASGRAVACLRCVACLRPETTLCDECKAQGY